MRELIAILMDQLELLRERSETCDAGKLYDLTDGMARIAEIVMKIKEAPDERE